MPRLVIGLVSLFVGGVAAVGGEYVRTAWPHWVRSERVPCRDVRTEVLIRDGDPAVTDQGCKVYAGAWVDAYSHEVLTEPAEIDVDHMVPLRWAHEHGGAYWPAEKKRRYANDLAYVGHLVVTSAHLNRQKGARGPADWAPPAPGRWCDYGRHWAVVLVIWDLRPVERDREAIARLVTACEQAGVKRGG